MSSFLLSSATPPSPGASPAGPPVPSAPPVPPAGAGSDRRSSALSVIAFVGVLLLAMGVGVLIGRAGNSKSSNSAPQVITVDTPASTSGSGSTETPFASNWPAGKSGYAVQLQTLAVSGTAVSAVEAAKSSATAKGAKNLGALKSEEFSSLASGNYVIYSGDYAKRSEAQKALSSLKKSFPAARVIHVSEGSGSGGRSKGRASSGSSGRGSTPTKESSSSLEKLGKSKGKTYEEESKNLPDEVETR